MNGELVPQPPQRRMSDMERDRITERLRTAVGEGRLTMDEFEQRLSGVLAARTFGEVGPYVDDLPGGPVSVTVPEFGELRTTAAGLKRRGRWVVPRRLQVTARAGTVKLDFTDAVIGHQVVEIQLDVSAGATILVVPHGASADVDGVELVAGSMSVGGGVPQAMGSGPHFVVRGAQRAGRVVVRHQRRFLKWHW